MKRDCAAGVGEIERAGYRRAAGVRAEEARRAGGAVLRGFEVAEQVVMPERRVTRKTA
jgi:hypothetical protein